jgi:nitrite reductase/ring-hydroxylating ferredoxin subunit
MTNFGGTDYRFITFRLGAADTIWCGTRRAFLLEAPGQSPLMVDSTCPHRGGPLALGQYDCRTFTLRCPWHGRRHGRRQLEASAWPALRAGDCFVVALPLSAESDQAIHFLRGQLAPALPHASHGASTPSA